MEVTNDVSRWLLCILSFFLVAVGITIEVCADVSLMAGDGLVKAISHKSGVEFGKTKVAFDCTLTAGGAVIGLLFFRSLPGVREGTIAAAIFIGMIIRMIYRLTLRKKSALLPYVCRLLHKQEGIVNKTVSVLDLLGIMCR